jgi:hypothetical protein
LTEYCRVEPVGQALAGAVILPPVAVQDAPQVLFTTVTLAGAVVKVEQVTPQVMGTVVALADVLTQLVVVFLHRAYTVMADAV